MGQPNFKRLAELGQLPDYIKQDMPSLATISDTVASQTEEIVAEQEVINDISQEEHSSLKENTQEGVVGVDEDGHGEFIDDLLQ